MFAIQFLRHATFDVQVIRNGCCEVDQSQVPKMNQSNQEDKARKLFFWRHVFLPHLHLQSAALMVWLAFLLWVLARPIRKLVPFASCWPLGFGLSAVCFLVDSGPILNGLAKRDKSWVAPACGTIVQVAAIQLFYTWVWGALSHGFVLPVVAGVSIVVVLMVVVVSVDERRMAKHWQKRELDVGAIRPNRAIGIQRPTREAVYRAGCHSIKKALTASEMSKTRVQSDDVELSDVEMNEIRDGHWEVSGRYSIDELNLRSQWRVVVNVVTEGDSPTYETTEIWTGELLDNLQWKKA